jgi:hypothetical protein
MKSFFSLQNTGWMLAMLLLCSTLAFSQIREYRIHDRGMLHETVYNTGEIARGYQYGQAGEKTDVPLMEWPSRSRTIIEGIEYSGQHNTIGAGIYVSANMKSKPGTADRKYALCGGAGTTTPELPFGIWSYPISIEEIENFPIIVGSDGYGVLNPNYNPDEAEEIIIAKWSTPTGITVTRTSRSWSYPDFDDMIIYEYVFANTGDTDGRLETAEFKETLTDVLVHFQYTFAPSMLGLQRNYGSFGVDYFSRADHMGFYDYDYWLYFPVAYRTGAADEATGYLAAHPEPNKELFQLYASTGLNGGGLESPQAPGFCVIEYDTTHLAIVDPLNPALNESEVIAILGKDNNGKSFEVDEKKHLRQPYNIMCGTANHRSDKIITSCLTMNERWGGVISDAFITSNTMPDEYGVRTTDVARWRGRGYMAPTRAWNGSSNIHGFGPYTLDYGDKIEFVVAEVIGYGANSRKEYMTKTPHTSAPSWNRKVVIKGETMTEHYLDDFGYPDYVNSNVITVNQVAHKAFEAYLGKAIPFDSVKHRPSGKMMWPEDNPVPSRNPDKFKIPAVVPAPITVVRNTPRATVEVLWNQTAERFTHPRLTGNITSYRIYRATEGMGPWTLLTTIAAGQVNSEGLYYYEDMDSNFKVGDSRYYSVTSVDGQGMESGRTNITFHTKHVAAAYKLDKVHAVPNPFVKESGLQGQGMRDAIGFYGLPKECTIRIFSYAGQLVETIQHNADEYSTAWFQVTRNRQDIASGIYVYVVETPAGEKTTGKLIVIK